MFDDYVKLREPRKPSSIEQDDQAEGFSILVKREDNNQNLWHTMMEIMSMTMSLDVLRQAINPRTGRSYWTEADIESTQVLILDDLPNGPYHDLWSIFAKRPPTRFSMMDKDKPLETNLIVPLAGSSNPFWQDQWVALNCGESALLKTFSDRVLDFYNISENVSRSKRQLVVTFVDRQAKRRLLQKAEYIDALKLTFPDMDVRVVDFAELDLAAQIRVAHSTDILVGVHGAGLIHGMFLPPHSAVVEIQPHGVEHYGFDMMAKSLGHRYYVRHASKHSLADDTGDWQHDDVFVSKDVFLDVVSNAVRDVRKAISNR